MISGQAMRYQGSLREVSDEFKAAVNQAIAFCRLSGDEPVRYMVETVPIYAQFGPTQAQAMAGGCVSCIYLGLWADHWPGYPDAPHGMIWLFEDGIRRTGSNLFQQCKLTLIHEMDHALQRDHVLAALNQRKLAAMSVQARGQVSGCAPCSRGRSIR